MSDAAVIKRLSAKIEPLEAERDELRKLLKEVLDNPDEIWGELSSRIDAALKEGE